MEHKSAMSQGMTFYWFDHTETDEGKPGLAGLSGLMKYFVENVKDARSATPPESTEKNVLYFVHAVDETSKNRDDFAKHAAVAEKRFVVFVSSEQIKNFIDNPDKGAYAIKNPLQTVVEQLTTEKAEIFIKSCENGRPDMTIFELLTYPEYLIAAYLLQVANKSGKCNKALPMDESFWKAAMDGYKAHNKFNLTTPGSLSLDSGCNEIRSLFTKITEGQT